MMNHLEDMGMAKKGMLDAGQKTVVGTAKAGARGVKSVASDALGAAASAAAGVVLDRVSKALGSGQNKLEKMSPAAQQAVQDTTKRSKKNGKKSVVKKEGSARKLGAAKKRSAGQKKSAGKASKKRKSAGMKKTARRKSA